MSPEATGSGAVLKLCFHGAEPGGAALGQRTQILGMKSQVVPRPALLHSTSCVTVGLSGHQSFLLNKMEVISPF